DRGGGHGAHQRDARDGVAARHQRRVQLRRDLADELEAQEHGQHEDEQQQQDGHLSPSTTARTRSSLMTPPLVNNVEPMTSSVASSLSLPFPASQACSSSRKRLLA